MSAQRVTVTLDVHSSKGKHWVAATAWGVREGRYGSLTSVSFPVASTSLPKDPEELVSLLLTSLSALTYHS